MKKIILILAVVILFSFVSAQDIAFRVVENEVHDIKFACALDGGVCDNSVICNLTISYPNSTILINGENTTNLQNGFFNYTLNSGQTTPIGIYQSLATCTNETLSDTLPFYYEVTPTGNSLETSESILYIVVLIATFLLFLAFLYPAIKLPYSNERDKKDGSIIRIVKTKYLKLLSIWFAYGFFMWFLQTLNAVTKSYLKVTYLSGFITNIFNYSQGFSVAVTFLILSIAFVALWKDIVWNKAIKEYGKAFIDGRFR